MKKKTYCLLLITCIVAVSCKRDKNTRASNNYKITETDETLSIPINSDTYNSSTALFYFQDKDSNYIAFLNKNMNEIQFFNKDSLRFSFTVRLDEKGPNGVGKIAGFYMKSLDSIYVTSTTNYFYLYIVNRSGEVIKKYNTGNIDQYDYIWGGVKVIHNPMIVRNNTVTLGVFLADFPYTKEKIEGRKLMVTIDENTDSTYVHPLEYPDLSSGNGNKIVSYIPSFTFNGSKYVFSFGGLNDVFVSEDLKTFESKTTIKSKFLNKEIPPKFKRGVNFDKETKKYLETPNYRSIIYDKYRNIY